MKQNFRRLSRRFPAFCLLLFLIALAACATRPQTHPEIYTAPPAEPLPGPFPEPLPEPSPGTIPPAASLPVRIPRPIEEIARRVKDHDPALIKYFTQDTERHITVHAESEGFKIDYDLENARPSPGGSRWELDFSVQETGSAELLRDTLLWDVARDDTGILLSMDDDYQEQWTRYFDLFDRYGAKITFFTIGGVSPFCREALDRGHDIGYHTKSHLNLPRVSRRTFYEQTLEEVESYRQAGIPLSAFAYPFGLSDPWMHEALADTFAVQRGFGVRYHIYDRAAVKAGYIISVSIDNITYPDDTEFEAAITSLLRTVKFIGGGSVVPLTTHTIADDAGWGIKVRRLEYLLQCAQDLKLQFYRYGDF
ncbi:MAG: polysaccharide deacetylase family protein [Treponema sp.]|jgi:peptidoglycan/xylan/chitin deacetylase (PgdA/CDA1 family)|nr:polysaccharide deacetylase family protein [Treponema sp.]